ncbi:MAG: hypothetical protein MJ158_02755 [Alphaproteobacteria bacterium]|nr:hypothetical protein [Alphaproteobacteria bacterium]
MKKTLYFVLVLLLCIGMAFLIKNNEKKQATESEAEKTVEVSTVGMYFPDGLPEPNSVTTRELDLYETGIERKEIFNIDINKDGKKDRITKQYYFTWTAHSYYDYKIELNTDNGYIDVSKNRIFTTEGADCDTRQLVFSFSPNFKITVIYRELGEESWNEETMAYKKTFTIVGNELRESKPVALKKICDVKLLFD